MAGTLQDLRPKQTKVKPKQSKSVVIAVVGLHAVFIWMLASGLAGTTVELIQNIDAALIEEAVNEDAPPPPPPPDFVPPPPMIAPPEITIDLTTAPPPDNSAITNVTTEVQEEAPPPPPPPPTPPTCIPANCERAHAVTERDYPPISIRLQEQGTVRIRYQVTATGEVGEVQVVASSGSERLDQAAMTMVQRRWRFEPATQNGQPVAVWLQAAVVFQLR